jgi:hypothetical protein
MAVDLLNRRISFVAAFFAFVGVILGVVALSTNYWTLENYVTPGTAVPTSNGTVLTSEHVDWTWNVSFILFKIDEIGTFFSLGSFLSMFNSWKCWLFITFLVNNIYPLFIRINLFISWWNLHLLGFIQHN